MELLEDRLRDYDARVGRVGRDEVATSAAEMLRDREVRRMVAPAGLAAEWLPGGVEFVVDKGLTATELDAVDGVMTGATLAIAEMELLCCRMWRGREDERCRWCRTITCA